MLIASQIITIIAWLYLRRISPPIERFMVDNALIIGHLLALVGIVGRPVARWDMVTGLMILAAPTLYNIARYLPELKRYEATYPRGSRSGVVGSAGQFNRQATLVCAIFGEAVVLFLLVTSDLVSFSQWYLLAMLSGFVGVFVMATEAWHRRQSHE